MRRQRRVAGRGRRGLLNAVTVELQLLWIQRNLHGKDQVRCVLAAADPSFVSFGVQIVLFLTANIIIFIGLTLLTIFHYGA